MLSAAATPAAWIGPAPPNAIMTKPAGSRPRSTETDLIARTMFEFAIRWMPWAASSSDSPDGSAMWRRIAASASARSTRSAPPASESGLM